MTSSSSRSRYLLALDRMIESVQHDVRDLAPGNFNTRDFLSGELKGLRAARAYAEAEEARIALSEKESINAAPQGTEGYGLCDDNLGNVPAVAAPSSGDKQQQFTCPKCGHIGAGPESRLPLCDRCDYRVRMLPSHNGRIFAPRTNAIAKWQEHVTVDDYNRMVDHARELEAELATLAPSHAAPVGPRGDAYKRAYQYLQGRLESIGYYGWAHDMDGEIEDVLTSSATAPIATVINNNQPGWTAIIETEPHVTLDVGTKLYRGPQ
jgi:hypothetical protein